MPLWYSTLLSKLLAFENLAEMSQFNGCGLVEWPLQQLQTPAALWLGANVFCSALTEK
jgi:hypothetical protein